MELALRSGILLFNVESASELHPLAATAARLKKKASIAIRVNPDVSAKTHPYISTGLHQHKFGVPIPEARRLYAEAAPESNLIVAGVSVHIGSQITDVGSFKDALSESPNWCANSAAPDTTSAMSMPAGVSASPTSRRHRTV